MNFQNKAILKVPDGQADMVFPRSVFCRGGTMHYGIRQRFAQGDIKRKAIVFVDAGLPANLYRLMASRRDRFRIGRKP